MVIKKKMKSLTTRFDNLENAHVEVRKEITDLKSIVERQMAFDEHHKDRVSEHINWCKTLDDRLRKCEKDINQVHIELRRFDTIQLSLETLDSKIGMFSNELRHVVNNDFKDLIQTQRKLQAEQNQVLAIAQKNKVVASAGIFMSGIIFSAVVSAIISIFAK